MKHTVMMWLTETTEKYKIALSVNDLDGMGCLQHSMPDCMFRKE